MIYAIGDIHGETDALRELLADLPLQPPDLVIFLGDLINRGGPDPFDCVEQVLAFKTCRKVFIQGNHEESMLLFLEEGARDGLTGMGGQSTIDSYARAGFALTPGDPASLPESHYRLYAQAEPWTLPFYITDDYIFTHAGWDLSVPLHNQSAGAMRWGRVKGFERPVWTQTVVRGHSPVPQVTFARARQSIGLDTGSGMGGFLSAIALPSCAIYTAHPRSFNPHWYAALRCS